jgi:hypothetical protein
MMIVSVTIIPRVVEYRGWHITSAGCAPVPFKSLFVLTVLLKGLLGTSSWRIHHREVPARSSTLTANTGPVTIVSNNNYPQRD